MNHATHSSPGVPSDTRATYHEGRRFSLACFPVWLGSTVPHTHHCRNTQNSCHCPTSTYLLVSGKGRRMHWVWHISISWHISWSTVTKINGSCTNDCDETDYTTSKQTLKQQISGWLGIKEQLATWQLARVHNKKEEEHVTLVVAMVTAESPACTVNRAACDIHNMALLS